MYRQSHLTMRSAATTRSLSLQQLNQRAVQLYGQGKYAEAAEVAEQALALARQLWKGDHPDLASSLNNLAALYHVQGRYSEAEPYYQQALAMTQRLFPGDHPVKASSLNGLAGLYDTQGRYSEAEPYYQQALIMRQRLFPGDHADLAVSLNNLAALYNAQGRYSEAESYYQRALAMTQRLFKGDHPYVAGCLNNLAFLYDAQGSYSEAEFYYQKALAMRQCLFPGDHPDLAQSLNNLAELYRAQGRYSEAEPYLQQALAMFQRLFDGDHPDLAQSLNNLATLLAATNRPAKALELIQKAIKIQNRIARRELTASSESNRLRHLEKIGASLEAFLSLVFRYFPQDKAAVRAGLDAVLARKSLGAAAQAAQNQALYSNRYPHLQEEFRQLRQLSDEIIQLTYVQPDPELVASKQKEFDRLEAQLAAQVPEIQLQLGEVDRRAVALELPESSTLVEFVRFRLFDFKALEGKEWQQARYIAFILPAGESDEVKLIDLGEAEHIDKLIRAFRAAASGQEDMLNMWDEEGEESSTLPEASRVRLDLGKALFQPLRETLAGARHLFLAPDGGLNLLPFQVLPADEAGEKLLIEDYTISYLSVGRDILRFKLEAERPAGAPLILADPDFDLMADGGSGLIADVTDGGNGFVGDLKVNSRNRLRLRSARTVLADGTDKNKIDRVDEMASELLGDLAGIGFGRAPGTRYLGERVAEMLEVEARLGADALESHLKANLAPEILLIATHGYFSRQKRQQVEAIEKPEIKTPGDMLAHPKVENPMLRSGLALAGANTWLKGGKLPEEAGKGFLFAQEVAQLDLRGNEIAVLSACNTAMGDVKAGEGVFGLRRAFAIAGTKTLVMSLWPVPDKPTALLMEQFFNNLEKGKARALQEAQDYIRGITVKELRQSELGLEVLGYLLNVPLDKIDSEQWAKLEEQKPLEHPFYWGAWICQGEV